MGNAFIAFDSPPCKNSVPHGFDPLFATSCTPDNPLGSCMVSDEGACAAYYTYGRFRQDAIERRAQDKASRRAAKQGQAVRGR